MVKAEEEMQLGGEWGGTGECRLEEKEGESQ